MTIGEIVAADYRAAAVFERRGLDFCCRGARTLEDSCRDAGIKTDEVRSELEQLDALRPDEPRFAEWAAPALVDHIVATHHDYVRQAIPVLVAHTQKIARVHGRRHPELIQVAHLFEEVAEEMTSHMMKEEQVLFPYIVALAVAAANGTAAPAAPFGPVANPIRMMEAEHESTGNAMHEIRALTNGFTLPGDACATYAVCFRELDAFEKDLHTHVHLENTILFPKALILQPGR